MPELQSFLFLQNILLWKDCQQTYFGRQANATRRHERRRQDCLRYKVRTVSSSGEVVDASSGTSMRMRVPCPGRLSISRRKSVP
jgi:hypothetical protein